VDLDTTIFNPISSKILKLLRFKFLVGGMIFQPCTAMLWDCLIVLLLALFDCWVILVDFREIRYGGNAIQGDLVAIIFNPTASIIFKLLRFKFVR
jgi:hypothetical protein